jgi:hypothetical protein
MRLLNLVLVATLVVPTAAIAQMRDHRPPDVPFPQGGIPLPQIGLPLPTLGLSPFSPIERIDWFHGDMGPFSRETGRIDWFHDRNFPATLTRFRNHGTRFPTTVITTPFLGVPAFFYAVPEYVIPVPPPGPAPPAREVTQLTTGSLVLQVQPASAQLFVDGYYFGTPADFDGRQGELALEAGVHRVQLVAPGYESVTVDVNMRVNQTVRYQNVMKPVAATPPPSPAAPITPKTLYLVPGCYLGDVPPKDAHLPATCDVTKVVTFTR